MTPSDIQFTGTHSARLDSSLRLHIPADWQHSWTGLRYLIGSRKGKHAYLKALNEAAYEERVRKIRDSHNTTPKKIQLLGAFALLCREAKPDRRNRISLPKDLADHVGLVKSQAVTLVGGGKHFEIWDTGSYEASMQQGQDP